MIKKILLATENPGKISELLDLLKPLGGLGIDVITPAGLGLALRVSEDGKTYSENAAKKALAYARAAQMLALGDDSGLEVDALGGQPGLYSARFSPIPGATDADRRARLLEVLKNKPRPWTARFRCLVALASPDEDIHIAEGICPGEIVPTERGTGGFGYDPIFQIEGLCQTMAELPMDLKNQISHRARAVQAIIPTILERMKDEG